MSIWSSLYTGSSGLGAFGDALGIVGDNIANVSTTGFKASRAAFADVLGGTLGGQRLGGGVRLAGAETLFGQGSLVSTGRALDLAVRGDGFFVVEGAHDGAEGQYYTRDGRFGFDTAGRLVNGEGLRLLGYDADASGAFSSALSELAVEVQSTPRATTEVSLGLNLGSAAPTPPPFDPTDPGATSSYSTSVTVYDSLGAAHRVDVYFRAQGNGQWEWHALAAGEEVVGGAPGQGVEIASGSLGFTASGALDVETVNASSVDFVGAEPGQAVGFDFGESITTDGGDGRSGTTQYAADSSVGRIAQDGFASGALLDVAVAEDGVISATYSNGQSRAVGRVAIASFRAESGLVRAGAQLYAASLESGEPGIAAAGTGGRGAVAAGSLEGSNVDLGNELVTLIAYQRAFQANTRVVTSADEMLAETTNLKR